MWLKTSEFCVVYSGNSPCWIAWVELGVWLGECGSSWNIWVEFEARVDVCGTIVVSLVEDLLYFQFGPVLSQCIINNTQLMCNMWTMYVKCIIFFLVLSLLESPHNCIYGFIFPWNFYRLSLIWKRSFCGSGCWYCWWGTWFTFTLWQIFKVIKVWQGIIIYFNMLSFL